jgi:hypothetical protein
MGFPSTTSPVKNNQISLPFICFFLKVRAKNIISSTSGTENSNDPKNMKLLFHFFYEEKW